MASHLKLLELDDNHVESGEQDRNFRGLVHVEVERSILRVVPLQALNGEVDLPQLELDSD